jgi:hypothetical protein
MDVREQSVAEDGPEMIICRSCEQSVPSGSLYCPYCCGADGRRGATKRGAFVGGVFGLLAGGLASAAWSSVVGAEHAGWGVVGSITLGGVTIGIVLGAILNHRA